MTYTITAHFPLQLLELILQMVISASELEPWLLSATVNLKALRNNVYFLLYTWCDVKVVKTYALKYVVHNKYSTFVFFLLSRWASVADDRQCIRTSQAYSTFSEPVWPLFIVCHREYFCSKIGHHYHLSLMFVDVLLLLVFETLAFIGQCCNSQLDWLSLNQAFGVLIQLMRRLTTHLQFSANDKRFAV